MSVVTVTLNPCIDKSFRVERVIPDRQLDAEDVRMDPGGGGLNVARAIHALGGDALALWTCGGTTGTRLAELLDEEGVHHQPVRIEDLIRENLIVSERSSQQQYRFGMPGPDLREAEREGWSRALHGLSPPPDHVVFSGSLPRGVDAAWYRERIAALRDRMRVVVDAKKEALAAALGAGVYLVKPNVSELGQAVGRELSDDDEIEQAAGELIAKGAAGAVLVSLGRGGAMLVHEKGVERFAAPSVRTRSRIGAGDSMVGGLVHGLDQGWTLRDATALGVAAGAACVMTEGTELCRREDVERLYERTRQRAGRDRAGRVEAPACGVSDQG